MAVTTTTLAVIAAAAAVAAAAGTTVSALSAKGQAEAQAEIFEQQAEREREVAGQQEIDFRKRQRRAAAAVRAAGGARGIDIGLGSPLLAAEDFAREAETQALRIREGGEFSATRAEQEASLLSKAGTAALISGGLGAGSSLLRGGGRTARILS